MKTFLVVTLYAALVAVLDLGGAVWANLHAAHPAKAPMILAPTALPPTKMESADRSAGTIPSDT